MSLAKPLQTTTSFFDVYQQIHVAPESTTDDDAVDTSSVGAELIAECYVRMVFLKAGNLSAPPMRIMESINARRSDLSAEIQWSN